MIAYVPNRQHIHSCTSWNGDSFLWCQKLRIAWDLEVKKEQPDLLPMDLSWEFSVQNKAIESTVCRTVESPISDQEAKKKTEKLNPIKKTIYHSNKRIALIILSWERMNSTTSDQEAREMKGDRTQLHGRRGLLRARHGGISAKRIRRRPTSESGRCDGGDGVKCRVGHEKADGSGV